MTKHLLTLAIAACCSLAAASQELRPTMTEHLRSVKSGEGIVIIHQNERLDSIMAVQPQAASRFSDSSFGYGTSAQSGEFITSKGYRIQIFSGNNQKQSKETAYSMERQLRELYPELDTYVTFQSPFWKLRAGNYHTSEEAHAVLRELKTAFPKWKEMFIVKDAVQYRVDRPGN
jgi:antitoxin (DNA-binding transcriptional repressor) of toxin-antitoxin stability system